MYYLDYLNKDARNSKKNANILTPEVFLSMFCFNLHLCVFLLNSSKNFKRHPRKNLMFLIQGSVEEKFFYVPPIFSSDIKEKKSGECVPSIYNVQKRKKNSKKIKKILSTILERNKNSFKKLNSINILLYTSEQMSASSSKLHEKLQVDSITPSSNSNETALLPPPYWMGKHQYSQMLFYPVLRMTNDGDVPAPSPGIFSVSLILFFLIFYLTLSHCNRSPLLEHYFMVPAIADVEDRPFPSLPFCISF